MHYVVDALLFSGSAHTARIRRWVGGGGGQKDDQQDTDLCAQRPYLHGAADTGREKKGVGIEEGGPVRRRHGHDSVVPCMCRSVAQCLNWLNTKDGMYCSMAVRGRSLNLQNSSKNTSALIASCGSPPTF